MLLVLAQRTSEPAQQKRTMTVRIVDLKGHVRAAADFIAPPVPFIGPCAPILAPAVRVAAGGAYFADSTGAVHRLDPSGANTVIATFKLTSPQSMLSFAVSPDGGRLIAIIFSAPPVLNPIPPLGTDPFVAGGHWTLDLANANAGSATTLALHKDYGTSPPTPGPTLIAGWDDAGPTATLGSFICAQQQLPSVDYAGSELIHLGLDGTHIDQIGGAGCQPWDELRDGTVLCGAGDWAGFSVRTRTGVALWSRQPGCCLLEPRLSPDGSAVVVDGDGAGIYSQYTGQGASASRYGDPVWLLGWAGSDYAVVLNQFPTGRVGIVPVSDPSNVMYLGLAVGNPTYQCPTCIPNASLAGTIG
jgi:hypothetical protein